MVPLTCKLSFYFQFFYCKSYELICNSIKKTFVILFQLSNPKIPQNLLFFGKAFATAENESLGSRVLRSSLGINQNPPIKRYLLLMGLPENVNFARNFAVMVRVQGPVSPLLFGSVRVNILFFQPVSNCLQFSYRTRRASKCENTLSTNTSKSNFHCKFPVTIYRFVFCSFCSCLFLFVVVYSSGKTTLSASGMLLPDTLYDSAIAKHLLGERDRSPVLVVTVASIIEPFLAQQQKESISQVQL